MKVGFFQNKKPEMQFGPEKDPLKRFHKNVLHDTSWNASAHLLDAKQNVENKIS